jgi:Family of unknown function (DUF6444)
MSLALQGEVTELQSKLPALQHQIQELQNPMSRESGNSSAPPSLDPPTAKHQPSQSASGEGAILKADLSPRERLRELIHQSPRSFNKPRSTWTLQLLAVVCFETGIVNRPVSASTVGRELRRMRIRWKQSRLWQTSPDPQLNLCGFSGES